MHKNQQGQHIWRAQTQAHLSFFTIFAVLYVCDESLYVNKNLN